MDTESLPTLSNVFEPYWRTQTSLLHLSLISFTTESLQAREQATVNQSLTTDMSCPRWVTSSMKSYAVFWDRTAALFLSLMWMQLPSFAAFEWHTCGFHYRCTESSLLCCNTQDGSSWQRSFWLLEYELTLTWATAACPACSSSLCKNAKLGIEYMASLCCIVWGTGFGESMQHGGESPLQQPLQRRQRCWQTPAVHICTGICTGRGKGQKPPSAAAQWRQDPCKPEAEAAAEWWKHLSEGMSVACHQVTVSSHQAGSCGALAACGMNQHLAACLPSHLWTSNEKWSQREDLRSKNKDWDEDNRGGKRCFHRSALQDIISIVFLSSSLSFLRKEM